jgi:hypothetical protein
VALTNELCSDLLSWRASSSRADPSFTWTARSSACAIGRFCATPGGREVAQVQRKLVAMRPRSAEDFCEREVDEVESQGGGSTCTSALSPPPEHLGVAHWSRGCWPASWASATGAVRAPPTGARIGGAWRGPAGQVRQGHHSDRQGSGTDGRPSSFPGTVKSPWRRITMIKGHPTEIGWQAPLSGWAL